MQSHKAQQCRIVLCSSHHLELGEQQDSMARYENTYIDRLQPMQVSWICLDRPGRPGRLFCLPFSSKRGSAKLTACAASAGGVTSGSHSLRVRLRSVLTSTAAAARTLSLMSSTARSDIVQTSLSLLLTSAHLRPWSRSDRALQLASLLRHNLPPIS